MSMRTEYCGLVTEHLLGQTVSLCGWVQRRRDHGGVIFIDLRDREGLVQVVCDPDRAEMFATAEGVRNEFCVQIKGLVRNRPDGTVNAGLKSGKIEVLCHELNVLNASVTPPFQLDDDNLSETTRLTHRVLDLRRPQMQHNLRLRYRVAIEARKYLDEQGFIDIETPMLTKSTPEGARDYLVPSRVNAGQFFALPQSPQLFKQLLMVANFDRYYQITKCFRDEDLRADRQPEFTQIDCETSFLGEQEIRDLFEDMIRHIFKTTIDVETDAKFPVMPYSEAMARFGSDKPDLRVQLEFTELTDAMKDVDFKVFSTPANAKDGRVAALRVPKGGELSRGDIDGYTEFVRIYGAKGLAWIKVNERRRAVTACEPRSSEPARRIDRGDPRAHRRARRRHHLLRGRPREGRQRQPRRAAPEDRPFGIRQGERPRKAGWKPLWVVDFPMFEYDDEDARYVAAHHPFTSPKDEHLEYLETDPGRCLAKAYDMVLNGWEIGGGSVRIHREEVQSKVFRALKIGAEEAQLKFGFLLDALQYGAPPHGGIAFGLDRIVTMMAGADSIRDVIAFPKTQRAQDLLTQAPAPVDERQLRELHIRLRQPEQPKA